MALETGTYISDLVVTNPTSSDPKSQGDDHLRLLKSTIKTTFPSVAGAVTPTHTELNYVDGVTSAIQTQINLKAPLDSPALTGLPTTPTADVGTTGTQVASLDYVIATSLAGTLPGQTGNAGKYLGTDGLNAGWTDEVDTTVMLPLVGTKLATTTATESFSNKSLTTPVIQDSADTTKKANFVLSSVTAGQNRNITIADENMTLFTPYARLIGKVVVSSPSATVDLEGYFTSTYDHYIVTVHGLEHDGASTRALNLRLKLSGAYQTTNYSYRISPSSITSGTATIPIFGAVGTVASNNTSYVRLDLPLPSAAKEQVINLVGGNSALTAPPICAGHSTAAAIEGIRFYLSSDSITAGTFRIFGMRGT